MHGQRALYHMRGSGFVPPKKVGFIPHGQKGNYDEVCFRFTKHNCHERGEGGELENPCESMAK
jgi:hypothetical protein